MNPVLLRMKGFLAKRVSKGLDKNHEILLRLGIYLPTNYDNILTNHI